jgi:dsRNA-specific ribonuclease
MDTTVHIGYLTAKLIENTPEFKLYQSSKEFLVKTLIISDNYQLEESDLDLLQNVNEIIFVDFLKILNIEFDYENSVHGGLIVILKKDLNDLFEIDWDTIKIENLKKENFYDYHAKHPEVETEELLVRIIADRKSIISDLRSQANRLFHVYKIHHNMSPLTEYKTGNYLEHFLDKYSLETSDKNQPMVELKEVKTNLNFIQKNKTISTPKKENGKKICEYFIGEHFTVLPFKKKYVFSFTMIPAIIYRLVSMQRAQELKSIIEKSIIQNLKIKNNLDNGSWDSSIKFNKNNEIIQQNENEVSLELSSSSDNTEDENNNLICFQNNDFGDQENLKSESVPMLLIKSEKLIESKEYDFPTTYAVLQCLTLKSAHDNFDLERYEILGDCFLKLHIILRIYLMFPSTNEGNMADLKSYRASNSYLFKLATLKMFHKYIISIDFQPKVNWILPNLKKTLDDERFKFILSDKSFADSVEALIGCYLFHLGLNGAQSFIRWLDLKISNRLDTCDFSENITLPKPLLVKELPDSVNLCEFERFAGN